jgi:hypothetical protein
MAKGNSRSLSQRYFDSEDGARYLLFYPNEIRPVISIIDPRTGEMMKQWSGFVDAHEMLKERKCKNCLELTVPRQ